MYICNNCGLLFRWAPTYEEVHNELDDHAYEEYRGCPNCKSDDFEVAERCDFCGKYVAHDYIKTVDGTVACSDCYTMY